MFKSERQTLSLDAIRELQALDRSLDGEALEDEHAPIAQLVQAMRAIKPTPSDDAALALDARILARTLDRDPRRARIASRSLHAVLAHPAWAAGALAAATLAIAVPLVLPGAERSAGQPSTSAPAAPAPSRPSAAGAAAMPNRRAAVPAGPGQIAPQVSEPDQSARQVEETAALDIGVAPAAIQSTAQRVFTLTSAFHGYVQQSSVTASDGHGERGEQSDQGGATFQLRLPSSSVSSALSALAHLGHVRSETDTTNDVTSQFDALTRSLRDAEAQRSSLLVQLARAAHSESEEALERRLHAVERRISGLRQALAGVNSRVRYTNVVLSLTPQAGKNDTAGYLTVGGALHDGDRILTAALAVLVLVVTALLPFALIALAGWALLRAARRRLREQALDAG